MLWKTGSETAVQVCTFGNDACSSFVRRCPWVSFIYVKGIKTPKWSTISRFPFVSIFCLYATRHQGLMLILRARLWSHKDLTWTRSVKVILSCPLMCSPPVRHKKLRMSIQRGAMNTFHGNPTVSFQGNLSWNTLKFGPDGFCRLKGQQNHPRWPTSIRNKLLFFIKYQCSFL